MNAHSKYLLVLWLETNFPAQGSNLHPCLSCLLHWQAVHCCTRTRLDESVEGEEGRVCGSRCDLRRRGPHANMVFPARCAPGEPLCKEVGCARERACQRVFKARDGVGFVSTHCVGVGKERK